MRSAASLLATLALSSSLALPASATTESAAPAQGGAAAGPLAAPATEAAPADRPVADAVAPEAPKTEDQVEAPEALKTDGQTVAMPAVPDASTPQPPPQPAAAEAPAMPVREALLRQIAAARGPSPQEKAALSAFYESRGENQLWVNGSALNARAKAAIAEIRQADDWGLEASAFDLPAAPRSGDPADVAEAELKLSLAVLKYASHARGGRMDPKDLSNYIDREPPLLAASAVLAGIAGVDRPDLYLRKLHPQHPQFEKLRQAYLALRRGETPADASAALAQSAGGKRPAASTQEASARKVLHNMEQWRWMPEDLGRLYVWANIPDFTLRVMKDGTAIHVERLIAGKADTQTPIFSDQMETIVFHPFWGVPDSIKVKEILPSLARGGGVLEKNNLRIQYRGRDIDPGSVDWAQVDIRNFHVYQPPGGGNVLGVVKFLFPNKHQVYMHDTPTKNLFNATQRTFSHGCMRVRNPVRLAEVLLAEDKGWESRRVAALVNGGPQNNNVTLDGKIPVHVTYFTASVDDAGKLALYPDVYGHEARIQMGLEGKAHLIVKKKEDLGPVRAEAVSRLAETKPTWSSGKTPDWARKFFESN